MAQAAPAPTRRIPEARKAFHAEFRSLCGRWNSWDVWSDWLVMASCSVYNSIHRNPKIEEEYLQVARRYNADELAVMARLLGILVEGLEAETPDLFPDRIPSEQVLRTRSFRHYREIWSAWWHRWPSWMVRRRRRSRKWIRRWWACRT